MASVQEARERLEKAVARLESAQEVFREQAAAGPTAASDEQRGPDFENLARAVEDAQRENEALMAEREALADRIDGVIGRLRTVLQNGDGAGKRREAR